MKGGDKVIVLERWGHSFDRRAGSRLAQHVVCDAVSYFYVIFNGRRFELHAHEEGITWCRGHDLNSKEACALKVVQALSS